MKKILLSLFVAGLLAAGYGYYLWNKPHVNMAKASADFTLSAEQLLSDYMADESAANAKYLGKIVAVTGKVKESSTEEGLVKVMLDAGNENFGVYCTLDSAYQHPRKDFPAGSMLTFKGSCDGLNLDVQLSRCVEKQ